MASIQSFIINFVITWKWSLSENRHREMVSALTRGATKKQMNTEEKQYKISLGIC